jgi:DNA replication protein DnaC
MNQQAQEHREAIQRERLKDRVTEVKTVGYLYAKADEPRVLAWLDSWLHQEWPAGCLLLTGDVGVGKTHQAFGALEWLADTEDIPLCDVESIEAHLAPRLFRELVTASGRQRGELLDRVSEVEVLLLDDLGAMRWSDLVEDLAFELIDRRTTNGTPLTIITSNLNFGELASVLGDRTVSRLIGMSRGGAIELTGPDRRRQLVRGLTDRTAPDSP